MNIPAENPQLELVELSAEHVARLHILVTRNRKHLTAFGDYQELVQSSQDALRVEVSKTTPGTAFGVWFTGQLIGHADLPPRSSGAYVLGYWLDHRHTGNGYMTIACRALLKYGKDVLGARSIYAGVTTGNTASEAVLLRLGFHAVEHRDSYTLLNLNLD